MGFFDRFRRSQRKDDKSASQTDASLSGSISKFTRQFLSSNKYFGAVKAPMCDSVGKPRLNFEETDGWDSFFVSGKTTEKLPGFDLRSRRKCKLHYYNSNCLVIEASKTLHIITSESSKSIFFAEGLPEAMSISEVNSRGAILQSKNLIGYLNFQTGIVDLRSFKWQPFRSAVETNYWLVGTRETTEGPGDLYCFSSNGDYLWGFRFKEEFETGFGLVKATAYHLSISNDGTDILVSTMDRLYRFLPDGKLIARIALSDLREAEIREKEYQRRASLPKNPQTKDEMVQIMATEMAEQLIGGMTRVFSLNTPMTGFAHDPQTDYLFILENEGRLTAWDSGGELLWVQSFPEGGYYITWIDNSVIVSFRSGHTFWLDRDGVIRLFAKLPKEAEAILKVPGQEKYLVICEDRRLYEIDKHTGEVIQGLEGNRGMRLFVFQGRMFFYDGYLWSAPPANSWKTYQPEQVDHAVTTTELSTDEIAPQVKADKPFKKIGTFKNPEDYPIRCYAVDKKHKLFFVGRRKSKLSKEEKHMVKSLESLGEEIGVDLSGIEPLEESAIMGGRAFSNWNEVVCYDFSFNQHWAVSLFSELTSIGVSPEGDAIFVGQWGEGLAYDPGKLVVINKQGNTISTLRTAANPTSFHFDNSESGVFEVFKGSPYGIHRTSQGEWIIEELSSSEKSEKTREFGAGLHQISVGSYKLYRTDKKSYQISCNDITLDYKVTAAIYEAKEISNSGNLLIRIGNKTLQAISPKIEVQWKIKTKGNISSVIAGGDGFLVLSKEDITFITPEGKTEWRIGCPPNSHNNSATWLKSQDAFLWGAGDQDNFQITLISVGGQVLKGQVFTGVSVYREIDITDDESCFVLPFDRHLELYEIR